MLLELRVSQLGVIDDLTVLLEPGMTALTGETGAGKTLIVDAIALLMGAAADPTMVRPGAEEAVVEGRFERGHEEIILSRVVPARGRSRAYVDGRMVSAAQLSETGAALVDLHGQHAHQSLLRPAAQRAALDAAGGISTAEVISARQQVRSIQAALDELGGDTRSRARELDLLRYQLEEIDRADLDDPLEDERLRAEEETLADASGLRLAAAQAGEALSGDEGVTDRLGAVMATLAGRSPLAPFSHRLQALQDELGEVTSELRGFAERTEDDPERLSAVGDRRHTLSEIRRKYGETLAEVIGYREELRARVGELSSWDARAARLEGELEVARKELDAATRALWTQRRRAAPDLGAAVQARLADLAMARARFEVAVGEEPGSEDVVWQLGANPGEPVLPLTKVASGGELARTMLATRLAISSLGQSRGRGGVSDDEGPLTLVFDEVDAGVGGEAAVAVGRALADLAPAHQVLVVTHLPQVAASADHQVVVSKSSTDDRTTASARTVEGDERIVELSRMLSGSPTSDTARRHAEELLGTSRRPSRPGTAKSRKGRSEGLGS